MTKAVKKCFWCQKIPRVSKKFVMEYQSPYDGEPAYWRKLWEIESHCLSCAKEALYDQLNDVIATADGPQSYAEWSNSDYRVKEVKE